MTAKVTKDPKTGADEMQMPEYMAHGPAPPVSVDPATRALRIRVAELELAVHALQEQVASLQRAQPQGIILRGWTCACSSFNGEEKEPRTECRACGKVKP